MKIFHACMDIRVLLNYHNLFPMEKLNVMLSYGIKTRTSDFITTHRDKIGSLVCDSGTFSLNNPKALKSSHITIEGYIAYLDVLRPYVDLYYNFDSSWGTQGYEQNLENQKKLEQAGLHPVPVIHNLYGPEVDYYLKHYERVAIASNELPTYDRVWSVVDIIYNAGVRIHLFGTTRWDLLSRLQVHSCDSSNANQIAAYGEIAWWNPYKSGKNKTDYIYLNERLKPPQEGGHNFITYPFGSSWKTI